MKCVVCGKNYPDGKKHVCRRKAIRRFEAQLRRRDRELEQQANPEPPYGEQLADGFAMLGEQE
jgi:hypothetical protein